MRKEEWVKDAVEQLSSILLRGYTTKVTDCALLFRMMRFAAGQRLP